LQAHCETSVHFGAIWYELPTLLKKGAFVQKIEGTIFRSSQTRARLAPDSPKIDKPY
jgi:hypothetical protein